MFATVSKIELRLTLASIGVLFASMAWLIAAMTGADAGRCLPGLHNAEFHCAACYAAIAFLAAAVAPWPTRRAQLAR